MSRPPAWHGGGLHGSVVHGGNGRHQRKAQPEAVVTGAVVEPGEWQEQALDHIGRHDFAGVDDAQHRFRVAGGGRDLDGPAREVVALGVVEQVGDEPFEQHPVAGHRGFAQLGEGRDAARGAALECVFGYDGEVERVGESAGLVASRENQQYLDEPLGVINGLADIGGHR